MTLTTFRGRVTTWNSRIVLWWESKIAPWARHRMESVTTVWRRVDPFLPAQKGEISIAWYETGRIDFQFAGLQGRHMTPEEACGLLIAVAQEIQRRVAAIVASQTATPMNPRDNGHGPSTPEEVLTA